MAACFGGVVFSSSIQCFISLFQMAQNVNLRRTAVFLSVSFLAGWGCFPIAFVLGHSGLKVIANAQQWYAEP